MFKLIASRSFVSRIIVIAMAATGLSATRVLAQYRPKAEPFDVSYQESLGTIQLLGTYSGIGALLASVVGPGPTPGSERLYATYSYPGNTFDILSIDPDTGDTTTTHNPVAGESGAWGMTVGPDGNIYLGTLPHAHLLKLDTQRKTLVDLGRPSSTESYIWSVTFGSDNRLYGATFPNCRLVRYDPVTGELADLGTMDPTQQYARFVAAGKDGLIYVGVGPSTANIAVYQITTGQHAMILSAAQQAVGFAKVFVGVDGNVYGMVNGVEYKLTQAAATELSLTDGVPEAPGNVLSDGRTLSIGGSLSPSGSAVLTLAVTDPTTDTTAEHQIAYQGEEMQIMRIGFGPDGVLYGSTAMPAYLFDVDRSSGSLKQIGNVGSGEVYSFLNYGNGLLMGAYSGLATLMSYQPGARFSQASDSMNPALVRFKGSNDSWRPEAMIDGADGNVYAGALAGYGLSESPLIKWNVASGSVQLFDVVPDQSVVSLVKWHNFIIGGTSNSGGLGSHPIKADAQLFLWNPSTQEVEFRLTPVTGAATITDLIAAPNGLVYGIAGNTLFEFNPQTQQITASQKLPFSNVLYNSVSVDNAGRIWGLAASGIFVIDTTRFSTTLIPSSPLPITGGFAMSNGNIYFVSGPSVYSLRVPLAPVAVNLSNAQTTLSVNSALYVEVAVKGAGVTPTGTVTMSAGGYTSQAEMLSGGSYSFTIPANSLSAGPNTLKVSYSGDTNYASAIGTTNVTVTGPTFTLAASTPSAVVAGGSASSTIAVTGLSGYAGKVALTCSLTAMPSLAADLPTCLASGSTVTLDSGTTVGTTTVIVSTAAASAALARDPLGKGRSWFYANGAVALGLVVFLGSSPHRRSWRSLVGIIAVLVAMHCITGCSNTGPGFTRGNHGTVAGQYTFCVAGVGTPLVSPTPTTMFTLTVK